MPTSRLSTVFHELRQAVLRHDGAGLTDGRLLDTFINQNDEAAFEALVHRHGRMVWGVCRRILHNHQDVEDAFQSVFLVLVRKARSVRPREMVGNWLYGVAHQTALKAKAMAMRRKARESQAMPKSDDVPNDLRALLDQELKCLPDKYRAVILLCDLENLTRKEAARQLGCPEGTIAGRLARARTMLAKRLKRHGLMVSGGTLAGVLSQTSASASVPIAVISSTIKVAKLLLAGKAGFISSPVAVLMEGVVTAMYLTKLKTLTMVLLVAGVVALGGSWISQGTMAGQQGQLAVEGKGVPNEKESKKAKFDARPDKERLQGTWRVVQLIADERQSFPKDMTCTIEGEKIVMSPAGFGIGKPGVGLQEATYQLGSDKFDREPVPHGFNLTIPGMRPMRGILAWDEKEFQSDKDRFRISFHLEFWTRPTEIAHSKNGFLTLLLEREKDADTTSLDRERLQGKWLIVASEADGKKDELEDSRKMPEGFEGFIFDGDRLISPGLQEITFKLDATKTPKRISLFVTKVDGKEGKYNGIYSLEGDDLKFCVNWNDGPPPSNFETKKGSDYDLAILRRWRPETKEIQEGKGDKAVVKTDELQPPAQTSKAVSGTVDVLKDLELQKPGATQVPPTVIYQIHFEVTELREEGEKLRGAPTTLLGEGQDADFFFGESVITLEGKSVPLEGIGATASVNKLKDGRLRLDLRADRYAKKEGANADLQVAGYSRRIIKVISLEEKVTLDLEGIGKKDARIRIQLTVTSNTQLKAVPSLAK
ncbi:MAG TPA: sigma-70 family RNA polymerase sigma factor [Gemmataceae bacterium]|jgi:RNA polymerase sigma factor (sigma-70 family)|nr:sigma-70 family RNA polymerase sigma factor [Gemmataceae bacterium]